MARFPLREEIMLLAMKTRPAMRLREPLRASSITEPYLTTCARFGAPVRCAGFDTVHPNNMNSRSVKKYM